MGVVGVMGVGGPVLGVGGPVLGVGGVGGGMVGGHSFRIS